MIAIWRQEVIDWSVIKGTIGRILNRNSDARLALSEKKKAEEAVEPAENEVSFKAARIQNDIHKLFSEYIDGAAVRTKDLTARINGRTSRTDAINKLVETERERQEILELLIRKK